MGGVGGLGLGAFQVATGEPTKAQICFPLVKLDISEEEEPACVSTDWTGANVWEFLASRTSAMEAQRENSPSVSKKKKKIHARIRKRGEKEQEAAAVQGFRFKLESSLKMEFQNFPSLQF